MFNNLIEFSVCSCSLISNGNEGLIYSDYLALGKLLAVPTPRPLLLVTPGWAQPGALCALGQGRGSPTDPEGAAASPPWEIRLHAQFQPCTE